jgi:hypothetical protein
VAFDVALQGDVSIVDDANPLTKYIHIPLLDSIPKELHTPLRTLIKKTLWTKDTACGKIIITKGRIVVTFYLKGLRPPAWIPPKHGKTEET